MKTNNFVHILLGGFLALLLCLKLSAADSSDVSPISIASNFAVIGSQANQRRTSSTEPNFQDHGEASSPLDKSKVSGAEVINNTFGHLGRLTGGGRLLVSAGRLDGIHSVIADGVTSAYIIFKITGTFHYQFVSSISISGNVHGYVSFNGTMNSDGSLVKSGTISSGNYVLQVDMTKGDQNSDGRGRWDYSLSLTPSGLPIRFTTQQKANFDAQLTALDILENQLLSFAAKPIVNSQYVKLLDPAGLINNLAGLIKQDFLDPLDTNYTVLAQVVARPVTLLTAADGITQLEADAYNAWRTNLSQTVGISTALTTSIDRAQGAAYDGKADWETAQMNAAVQFEAQLAGLLDQEPALRSNVVAQFKSDGFPAITVTTDDALALQTEISSKGLPADLLDALRGFGVDPQSITNIQNGLLTADPYTMAGSFPESLANPDLDSAGHAVAAGLRDASLVLLNAGLLPDGRFRFDLPTEPGYTYTIQFTQNLANSAGWMTLVSNNAKTSLLSFTNTLPAGAQASFYRASHN